MRRRREAAAAKIKHQNQHKFFILVKNSRNNLCSMVSIFKTLDIYVVVKECRWLHQCLVSVCLVVGGTCIRTMPVPMPVPMPVRSNEAVPCRSSMNEDREIHRTPFYEADEAVYTSTGTGSNLQIEPVRHIKSFKHTYILYHRPIAFPSPALKTQPPPSNRGRID